MMNTMFCSRLPGASMNFSLCRCNLSFTHPCHIRAVPLSYSQIRIPQCTHSQLKLPEADIGGTLELEHITKESIHVFQKRGFTDLQIARIMRAPQVIGYPEEILESKLQVLEDFGFVDQNLGNLLCRSGDLLRLDLKNIIPKLQFLKDAVESNDALVRILLKNPRILGYSLEKTLKPSFAFWEGWDFSRTELLRFLKINPFVLTRTSLSPTQVDLINKFGLDKKSKSYLYIVNQVAVSRVGTVEAKIENLKLCGLSAEEAWQVVGSNPNVLSYSKENIREKMIFIVTNMDLPANYVVKHSSLLQMNLERTVKPRFLVCQKIKSIDGTELPLLAVLPIPETDFVQKIIETHSHSKLLWTIYVNALEEAKMYLRE